MAHHNNQRVSFITAWKILCSARRNKAAFFSTQHSNNNAGLGRVPPSLTRYSGRAAPAMARGRKGLHAHSLGVGVGAKAAAAATKVVRM